MSLTRGVYGCEEELGGGEMALSEFTRVSDSSLLVDLLGRRQRCHAGTCKGSEGGFMREIHPGFTRFVISIVFLFGGSSVTNAETASDCTRAAMSSVLKAFNGQLKVDSKCAMATLSDADPGCVDSWSDAVTKVETKLDVVLGSACTQLTTGDVLCANTASRQAYDVVRASFSGAPLPEPDDARRKCRRAITSAAAKLAKTTADARRKCNERAAAGDSAYGPAGPSCDDAIGSVRLVVDSLEEKLRSAVARRCGGSDHAFGGGDDLDPQDDLGFAETCQGGPDCTAAVPGLAELAECAVCGAEQDVAQATLGALAIPIATDAACLAAIDYDYTRLARDTLNRRIGCEVDVIHGRTNAPCPDDATSTDIADRESTTAAKITTSCAGLDPQDDLGFAGACADVAGCGSIDVADLAGEIECLRCVTAAQTQRIASSLFPVTATDPNATRASCRDAMGDEFGRGYSRYKLRTLERCDRERVCGQLAGACPDQAATSVIEEARARAAENVTWECETFDPQDLGFGPTCPDVFACGGQETDTLGGLLTCLTCIAASTTDAIHGAYVPGP